MIMADVTQKVVQIFLTMNADLPAIYEVSISSIDKRLACNCPGYESKDTCKHLRFVKNRLDGSDGRTTYLLRLDDETPEDAIDRIKTMSGNEYREFIIKYGKIEVL